jgi:hypothetical protein
MDPMGDPAAMRGAASALRLRAEQIVDAAQRIGHAADTATYAGPSADRLRHATADRKARLTGVAGRVQDIADLLARSAGEVDEAIIAAERAALADDGDNC